MFFDTDCGGVVHNIAYLRFIETARTLLAEELGGTPVEMAKTQRYPVVVRTGSITAARPGWATVSRIHRCRSLARARFRCALRFGGRGDDALIAKAVRCSRSFSAWSKVVRLLMPGNAIAGRSRY